MSIKSFFTTRLPAWGGGVSSTTVSLTPFHSHTKTPDAQNKRMSPKDNKVRPTLKNNNKVAPPPIHQGNGTSIPTAQWNIDKKYRKNNLVEQLDTTLHDDAANNYRKLLNNRDYFDFESSGPPMRRLHLTHELGEALAEVKDHLGDNTALPKEMKGAEMMVLTQAVALACKGGDLSLAARGLKCLREVDLRKNILVPEAALPDGFTNRELDCAWRIAQALEKTPIGFAALKRIAQPMYGNRNVHASVQGHDDTMLHVYLRASHEKHRLAKNIPSHPGGIFGKVQDPPTSLVDKSLLAVQNHLAQSYRHVLNNPDGAFTATRDANEWTIGAIRNGFYSDDLKDAHGKPTLFAKAEGRINKLSKWISRANGTNNRDIDGSNHEAIGKKTSTPRKLSRRMRNMLLPKMKKTPFNAFNRQPPEQLLPYVGATTLGSGFKNSEEGNIAEARAIKTMIDNLVKGLKANGIDLPEQSPATPPEETVKCPANPPAVRLTDMVRLTILKQVIGDTKIMPDYVNIGLTDKARTEVKEKIYAVLDGHKAGQNEDTIKLIDNLIDKQHTNLTPETLIDWAREMGCPPNYIPDRLAQLAPDQPDWHAFTVAAKRVTQPVQATPTPNLKTITKAETAEMLGNSTKNHELGSRIVLYSGGVFGFSTKGLTAMISNIFSFGALQVGADIRGERARYASMEIGTGAQGNELFLGTQKIVRGQVGGSVGSGAVAPVEPESSMHLMGGGVNAAIGGEGLDHRGVMIRFDRLKGGVPGDKGNNEKLARVIEKLIAPNAPPKGDPYANAQGEDATSKLKNLWQEWPEVSVGMVGINDRVGQARASASFGFGGRFGDALRLGFNRAGIGVEGKFKGKNTWRETGGSLHVDKNTSYWSAKVNVSGSLASVNAMVPVEGEEDVDVDLSPGEFFGGGVDIWKNGYSVKDILIEYEGELKRSSTRVKSYLNAQTFVDKVARNLDKWAEVKTKRFYPKEYGAQVPANETPAQEAERIQKRNAAIAAEHKRLSQYLQRSLDSAAPTQSFWEFLEVTEDAAAAANAAKSISAMAEECGDKKGARDCAKYREKLLKSETAWEPAFLVDNENTSQQRTLSVSPFLIKSAQIDGIIASNIKTFT